MTLRINDQIVSTQPPASVPYFQKKTIADWKGAAPLPSQVVARSQILAKVWNCFVFVLNLFLWITGLQLIRILASPIENWVMSRLCKKFELALYEDVVLSSNHRELMGAKTSVVLDYMCDFLKREKATPPDMLKALQQASNWSKQLEAADDSWTHDKKQTRLNSLSKEISQKIAHLKEGESAIVPGGLYKGDSQIAPKHYALYRITREKETFRLEIWSRDSAILDEATATLNHKSKTLSNIGFHSLKKEEIADEALWHALLSIQLEKSMDDVKNPGKFPALFGAIASLTGPAGNAIKAVANAKKEGNSLKGIESPLGKILAPFESRQIAIPEDNLKGYHAERKLCRIQNIWSLVHEKSTEAPGTIARRKLRLSLETLFRYFESTRDMLSEFPMHRTNLREGIRALAQTVLELEKKHHLSMEEAASISHEFKVIEDWIVKQTAQSPPSAKLSWLSSLSKVILKEGAVKPISSPLKAGDSLPCLVEEAPPANLPSAREPFPTVCAEEIDLIEIDQAIQKKQLSFSEQTLLQDLAAVLERGQTDVEKEYEIMRAAENLPKFLQILSKEGNYEEIPNNPWKKMSPADRFIALQRLTAMAEKLVHIAKEHSTVLPNRLAALVEIIEHSEYLARLDPKISKLTWQYRLPTSYLRDFWRTRSFRQRSSEKFSSSSWDIFFQWQFQKERDWEKENKGKSRISLNLENNPGSAHTKLLIRQATLAEELLPSLKKSVWYSREKFRLKFNEWGLSIDHPQMMAAAYLYSLGSESSYRSWSEELTATQEEVVANPKRLMEKIRQKYFDGNYQTEQTRGTSAPPLLPKELLEELLLGVSEGFEGRHIWNILGLIKKSPEILSYPDCRAFLELFFIRYQSVTRASWKDPELPKFLTPFFTETLEIFWQAGHAEQALFLLRLGHTLKFHHPEFKDLDFQHMLKQKIAESWVDGSPLAEHRHGLVTELLWVLQHKPKLSAQDARDCIYFGFFFEHLRSNPNLFDPVIDDQIRIWQRQKAPLLLQEIEKDRDALLDQICKAKKIPLPKDSWTGTFPHYKAGQIKIDLCTGNVNDDRVWSHLPSGIVRSKPFRKLFPHLRRTLLPQAKSYPFKGGGEGYGFLDEKGNEWRVELCGEQIVFYKHIDGQWHQYLKPEDLPASKELSTPLPSYILDQTLFASTKNPFEITSYDETDTPQFKIHLSTPWIWKRSQKNVKIDDLRPGRESRKSMEISPLSWLSPLFLHPLLGFEEGNQILVWSKGGQIQEVELPRHKLKFQIERGILVCNQGPYKGYRMEENPHAFGLVGLPSYLLLSPPTGSSASSKLLVPHFSGAHLDLFPSPLLTLPEMGFFQKWLLSQLLPVSQAPKYSWMQIENGSEKNFWTLDIRKGENPWDADVDPNMLLDACKYAIHQSLVDGPEATLLVKQLIERLKAFDPTQFNQESLLETVKIIGGVATEGNRAAFTESLPETTELALRLLLVLKEKASPELQSLILNPILFLSQKHASRSKHTLLNSLLDSKETEQLRKIAGDFSSESEPVQVKKQLFKMPKAVLMPATSRISESVISHLRTENSLPGTALFSKDPDKLQRMFPQVYQALKAPSTSLQFRKFRQTFKAIPNETSEFTDYMEMLFDLKQQKKDLALPDFPTVKYDGSKFFYRDDPFRKALHGFFINLDKAITPYISSLQEPAQSQAEKSNEPQAAHSPPFPPELDWEILENRISNNPVSNKAPSIAQTQPTQGLFLDSQLSLFFPKKEAAFDPIDLTPLQAHSEPSVRTTGQEIEKELETYKTLVQNQGGFRTIQQIDQIEALIQQKIFQLGRIVESADTEVRKYFEKSKASFTNAEISAGAMPHVDLSDLKTGLLQNDLKSVVRKMRNVQESELRNSLIAYFQVKTLLQHAEYVKKEIESAKKEDLLKAPATAEKLYQALTRPRGYQISAYPELLVLEDALGFLMDEKQIKMVQTILDNPKTVAQAVTGSGKTSVITVLLGLMKANGSNLVTLKFLDPLFTENAKHLQKKLAQVMKKKVLLFRYSTKTPTEMRIDKDTKLSLFKPMYENLLKVVLEKGCVLTDRRSLPLLEAKYIALLFKISTANSDAHLKGGKLDVDQIDLQHLFYLSKILNLMKERQECVYDEHDKALYPRDEIRLALGETVPPPEFAWQTIRDLFELAVRDPELRLKENTQDEVSEETKRKIFKRLADELAAKIAAPPGIESEFWEQACSNYFLGKEEVLLKAADDSEISPLTWDRISLTKDLFVTYLPTILSHKANKKYGLSEDGVSVIPYEYTDRPREGSEFENLVERLAYTTAYYYQKGVSITWLKSWLSRLRKDALDQMRKERIDDVKETKAQAQFAKYFPGKILPLAISDAELNQWCAEISSDPAKISQFLNLILPEIRLQVTSIPIDAQNQVSMSKASAGISATEGCKQGLHPQFSLPQEPGQDRAQMILQMIDRLQGQNGKPLQYESSEPHTILSGLLKEKPEIAVVIDGAGALVGVSAQEAAEEILKGRTDISAVSYFNKAGQLCIIGDPQSSRKGQHYSHDQSRGADVKLSPSLKAILLANGQDSLETVLQNVGRLRHPNHKLTLAVPQKSGIHSSHDLLRASLVIQAEENSDNLYRSEMQKMKDSLRSQMLDQLLALTTSKNLVSYAQAIVRFQEFQANLDLLVSKKSTEWDEPGSYFKAHREIQKREKDPREALREKRDSLILLVGNLGIDTTWLTNYDPSKLAEALPSKVWNNAHLTMGQQAQIEVEQQTEVQQQQQTETEVETVSELEQEPPNFLPWVDHFSGNFKIHSANQQLHKAYDENLEFTENYLPLGRKIYADKIHHRTPHDTKQNRLHYVAVGDTAESRYSHPNFPSFRNKNRLSNYRVCALDILDMESALQHSYGFHYSNIVIYDTYLNRFIGKENSPSFTDEEKARFFRSLAQLKFEDGQFNRTDYTDEEWQGLERWLSDHRADIASLKNYMRNDILKHRHFDKQKVEFSELFKLMDGIK